MGRIKIFNSPHNHPRPAAPARAGRPAAVSLDKPFLLYRTHCIFKFNYPLIYIGFQGGFLRKKHFLFICKGFLEKSVTGVTCPKRRGQCLRNPCRTRVLLSGRCNTFCNTCNAFFLVIKKCYAPSDFSVTLVDSF